MCASKDCRVMPMRHVVHHQKSHLDFSALPSFASCAFTRAPARPICIRPHSRSDDMKVGIFSISQVPDQDQRVQAFDDDMRQFKLADDLGYDTVWIASTSFRRIASSIPRRCWRPRSPVRLSGSRSVPPSLSFPSTIRFGPRETSRLSTSSPTDGSCSASAALTTLWNSGA